MQYKNCNLGAYMKIFVMRHGTTIWNEKGITQGRSNNRLSKEGKALAEESSKKYKDTKFDVIFSSPLMRTMQTSNIMNKYHNVKIIKDDRLLEIDQGIFSGKTKFELTPDERKLKSMRSKSCGMESYEEAYDRAKSFLTELKASNKYNSVLIVTHNVIASFLDDILKGVNVDYNNATHLRNFNNAEVKQYVI